MFSNKKKDERKLSREDIPERIQEYILKYAHLDKQMISDGKMFIQVTCPACGFIGDSLVKSIKQSFQDDDPKHDVFTILCIHCQEKQGLYGHTPEIRPTTGNEKEGLR